MNQLDFKGRHAVVTGGATGLGFAIAKRFIDSGGSVTLWDRDEAGATRAAGELGASANAVSVDVADAESVTQAVKKTPRTRLIIDRRSGSCVGLAMLTRLIGVSLLAMVAGCSSKAEGVAAKQRPNSLNCDGAKPAVKPKVAGNPGARQATDILR